MDDDDSELETQPVEELETQPYETYRNTGVICPVCSSVNLLKRHYAKGVFSFKCPSCRRKESNLKAHAKRRAKEAKEALKAHAESLRLHSKIVRSVNSQVNQLAAQAKYQRKRLKARWGENMPPRAARALVRRESQIAYYEQVRKRMLADAARHALLPTEHYLQDEKLYAQYIEGTCSTNESATVKSETERVNES